MALQVAPLQRTFLYNGMALPDPNPQLTIPQVQAFHATQYPELGNAKPLTESAPDGRQKTTFTVSAGTKG